MSGRSLRKTYRDGAALIDVSLRLEEGRLGGTVSIGEDTTEIDAAVRALDTHRVVVEHEGRRVRATVLRNGESVWVAIGGRTWQLDTQERGAGAAALAGQDDFAASPMTGNLTKVSVAAGDQVALGEELFVVEAMKMEYVVRAPRDVAVVRVGYAAGDQVEQGDIVVSFEEQA